MSGHESMSSFLNRAHLHKGLRLPVRSLLFQEFDIGHLSVVRKEILQIVLIVVEGDVGHVERCRRREIKMAGTTRGGSVNP